MGRGLSELQRYILGEAAGRDKVHPAEVLAGFFGWQPLHPLTPGKRPAGVNFSRDAVGADKYRSVMASLSRAVRRLEERGLVRRSEYEMGRAWLVRITPEGRDVLSVNTPANCLGVNR